MEVPLERLQAALAPHYRVLRPLGAGGMATVYLAEDLRHGRTVAIKVLDPDLGREVGPDRFLREIAIAAGLNHPHIMPLLDSGAADGVLFYVMPYASGESLRDRLRREHQLPLGEAMRIGGEIAGALAHAHAHGALHRDLKPDNILLQDDHALLADFGIAGALKAAEDSGLTRTGVIMGTPSYMSPEQASGQRDLDARSDLYSLGCVLYEMLAGQPPFTGPTSESVVRQHVNAPPPSVIHIRSSVPAGLADLIHRLLAKTPADRPSSAKEVSRALAGESVAKAVAPTRAAPGSVKNPGERRRQGLVIVGVVLLVMFAVAIAAWIWWPRGTGGERIQALAVLPLQNLSGDSAQQYFADGITEELTDALARIPSLRIISRTSASEVQGQRLPLEEIARRLHVDAVVEGSVTRIGTRVRITAALIRAHPELRLWGNQYEREVQDVLALQADVAQAIARQIRAQVDPEVKARFARARIVNPEAYEAYLQGRFLLNRVDFSENLKALQSFERAVAVDSTFAQAWAGISDAYYLQSDQFADPRQAMPLARGAALRAIRLDPDLAEGHAALGAIYAGYDWKMADAEREYRRAIELNPSYSLAHGNLAMMIGLQGRFDESDREFRKGVALNPLSSYLEGYRLWMRWVAGHTDEALAGLVKLERVEPDYAVVHYNLAQVYAGLGRYDEAVAEARKGAAQKDNGFAQTMLGYVLARAGHGDEAKAILRQMGSEKKQVFIQNYGLACIEATLGDKDAALRSLERCYESRDESILALRVDPKLTVLRSDPRFQDLARRVYGNT